MIYVHVWSVLENVPKVLIGCTNATWFNLVHSPIKKSRTINIGTWYSCLTKQVLEIKVFSFFGNVSADAYWIKFLYGWKEGCTCLNQLNQEMSWNIMVCDTDPLGVIVDSHPIAKSSFLLAPAWSRSFNYYERWILGESFRGFFYPERSSISREPH